MSPGRITKRNEQVPHLGGSTAEFHFFFDFSSFFFYCTTTTFQNNKKKYTTAPLTIQFPINFNNKYEYGLVVN